MIWPHEFRSLIRGINRIPAERSTGYELLRTWDDEPGLSATEFAAAESTPDQPVAGL